MDICAICDRFIAKNEDMEETQMGPVHVECLEEEEDEDEQ
jgi:hypothetical protein